MIEPPASRGELQSTAGGVPRSVGAWIRAFGVFRLAAIVAAAASLLYLWRDTNGRLLEASLWQVPLVLMLLVVSLPWRTVSIRTVAAFFFVGFGPLLLLTILSQSLLVASPLERWLQGVSRDLDAAGIGALGNLHSNVWAPLTEEIWKIVPSSWSSSGGPPPSARKPDRSTWPSWQRPAGRAWASPRTS